MTESRPGYPGHIAAPVFLAVFAVAAVMPLPALAQLLPGQGIENPLIGVFGTPHGDANSATLLNRIFGPLFPSPTGSVETTLVSVVAGYLNAAVLTLGGLLFAWNLAVGVLQSAHEGEILGRRWSSLWGPLRVLFATVLLVPVPGLGGYNSIQAGVAWTVRGSTIMASELWGRGSRMLVSGELPIAAGSASFDGEILKTVYRNQLCIWLANYQLEAAGSPRRARFETVSGRESVHIVSMIDGRQPEICGAYEIPEPPGYLSGRQSGSGAAVEGAFRMLHSEVLETVIDGANRAISIQWPALIAGDQPPPDISAELAATLRLANDRLAEGSRGLIGQLVGPEGGRDRARAAIERFINGGCDRQESQAISCLGEGWIGAGNWYMTLARLNSELSGLTAASITARESPHLPGGLDRLNRAIVVEAENSGWFDRMFDRTDVSKFLHVEEAERIWRVAIAGMEEAALSLSALGMTLPGRIIEGAAPSGATGLLGRIWRVGFADEIAGLMQVLVPSGRDPMTGLINIGNWFLDVSGALIFGGAAVSLLSGGFGTTIVFLIAAPMAAIGVSQSFIIPMLPFIYWILGIAAYFLVVAETVVAVTLWALMHFRMDGEGISGDAGRQGWLMLLSLVLTPSLMIAGYFFGMIIFRVVGSLLDLGIHYTMSALVHASPVVGIFGLIATGIVVVLSYVVIIERSFSLISEFPSRILKWVGVAAGIDDGGGVRQFRTGGAMMASSLSGLTRQLGGIAARSRMAGRSPASPTRISTS